MLNSLTRSYLFAPGDKARLLAKVFDAGADAVVLDLEDAVTEDRKQVAREQVGTVLAGRDAGNLDAWVRINALCGDAWRADVEAVCSPAAIVGLAGLRLPKAESPAELDELDEVLRRAEEVAGLEPGTLRLTCVVESAAGLLAARDLAAQARVSHLAFGEADFAADLGIEPGEATLWARSSLVVAARAADIAPPIAPVYTHLGDPEGLHASTLEARRLGFFGRSCIHPRQLAAVHEVFTPSADEVDRARQLVAAHDGGAAVTADGRFVDAAIVRRARGTVELAAALEMRR